MMPIFCDVCGREIFCEDELGRVDIESYRIKDPYGSGWSIFKTKTTTCIECLEEKRQEES